MSRSREPDEGHIRRLAVSRQCELAGVVRSWVYAPRAEDVLDELDLELLRLIDAEYTRRPFYGSRVTLGPAFLRPGKRDDASH